MKPELHRCEGKAAHAWYRAEDAAKCCNPRYKRCLCTRILHGHVLYGYYWLDLERTEEEDNGQTDNAGK